MSESELAMLDWARELSKWVYLKKHFPLKTDVGNSVNAWSGQHDVPPIHQISSGGAGVIVRMQEGDYIEFVAINGWRYMPA
ncbi:hypothetical protein M5J15_00365 [Serratia symbiotica]|uniref:hypothetical protein n=1 Tax=Serratia symbiotica TaxID=138074 RepID=UPI001D3CBE8E|nr:hypothetical protein [Serratia symbiotica]NIG87804.1 hypothetical protein [Serratia symbiotica]USS95786.1 hypothetical protein M5J15_00365 [Serratia symbiotica]